MKSQNIPTINWKTNVRRLLELCDDEENLLYPHLIRIYLFDGKGKNSTDVVQKISSQYSTISIKILNLEKIFLHSEG